MSDSPPLSLSNSEDQPLTIALYATPVDYSMPMLRAAVEWLKTKYEMKSQSQKTQTAYRDALKSFRDHLLSIGLDLESEPREVALAAQAWVQHSRVGRQVSTSTINQRYAILSSFYKFAIKYGACEHNPIDYCERPDRVIEDEAQALDADYIKDCIQSIDRSTREGRRDFALLNLACLTGRRLSELTGLQWQHISMQGRTMRVKWAHCKGAKVFYNVLDANTTKILLSFLKTEYGDNLQRIKPASYIFQSHSKNNSGGRLSAQTISQIYKDRLGFSKVHTTRHSFAVNSEIAGASLSEIGDQLGHSNYQTTANYLKRKRKNTYGYAGKLSSMFGFEDV